MLNECSPLRTIAYLVFILILTFIVFAGISDIIAKLLDTDNVDISGGETDENSEIDE